MIRLFAKPFLLALMMAFPWLAEGQIPAPQINLTGNVGTQGFPLLNSGTLVLSSDANHTMTAQETSAFSLKVTSSVSLTTTRSLIMPSGRFTFGCIENATTGGQSIQIISTSGTGVPIATGVSVCGIWNDGTNYVTGAAGGATNPISGLSAGCVPLGGTATTITSCSHIDDGVTQSGRLTSSETMQFGTFQNGMVILPGGSGFAQGWSSGGVNTWQIGNSNGQAQFGPLFVENGNTATSSANVNSPLLSIQGSYWNGTVPQIDTWAWQNVLSAGANPVVTLTMTHSGSTTNPLVSIPFQILCLELEGNSVTVQSLFANSSIIAEPLSNATSGSNQNSAPLNSDASYWNGSAPTNDEYRWTNVIGTGTNPSSVYTLSHTGATGGTSVSLPFPVSMHANISTGTLFTASATGCTVTPISGGSTSGAFTITGTGSCSVTITMGGGVSSPNAWACFSNDLSIGHLTFGEGAPVNTTQATFNISGQNSGDVINFGCIGY